MARRSLARLRNIGIVAHINAGKTTLTERFLFRAGRQSYVGAVDDGTATMDFMPEEQERGISISAAVTSVDWRGFHINVIDTPGHVDFTAEVERSLRVLDGVIVVLDAVRGVESQTEIVWRQVQEHRVPAIVFINKMDRETADFEASLIEVSDRLQCPAVPLVMPLRKGGELVGLCDLIENKVIGAANDDLSVWRPSRQAIVEACADYDESILQDFVEGGDVDADRLHRAVRRATLDGGIVPVLTGSALFNRGLDWLLTAVCRYLPSPLDRPVVSVDGTPVPADEDAPLSALVFKVAFDGDECLHFVRLYSGQLRAGELVRGSRHEGQVHVSSISRLHAAEHEEVEEIGAGDVAAMCADVDLSTGETLYTPGHPVHLESVQFPSPVLTSRLEALLASDYDAMQAAAAKLCREDPTLVLGRDRESGALLVSGMGELHLQVFEERLVHALGREVRLSAPQVLRHETVARPATASAECRRHLDGREYAARVELSVTPRPGTGLATVGDVRVEDDVAAAMIRRLLLAQLRAGMSGPHAAYDLSVDVTAASGDLGTGSDGVSAEAVVGEALAIGCRRLVSEVSVTLEPYVDCVVSCPADTLSGALADLRSRGVDIADVHNDDDRGQVRGELALSRVLGYATKLRSLTRGLGSVHLRPVGLRPVVDKG
jgi:elongation factor G